MTPYQDILRRRFRRRMNNTIALAWTLGFPFAIGWLMWLLMHGHPIGGLVSTSSPS